MRHLLVTGGAGVVGSHIVDGLLSAGYGVIVLDNLALAVHNGHLRTSTTRQRTSQMEVRNQELLRDLLSRVDSVSHQASAVGIGLSLYEMEEFVDGNARTTTVLFDVLASTETSVEAVVVTSSIIIYVESQCQCEACGLRHSPTHQTNPPGPGDEWNPKCPDCDARLEPDLTPETVAPDPRSVYATARFLRERLTLAAVNTQGITVTPLCYLTDYRVGQLFDNPTTGVSAKFLNRIVNENPIIVFEDGAQPSDFEQVSGVARANQPALERKDINGVVVNVETGEPTSIIEIAETLTYLCDADVSIGVTNRYRRGDARHCIADPSRASRLLSFDPTVSFEEGIRELVEWGRECDPEECFNFAVSEIERQDVVRENTERRDERPIVSGIARPTDSLGERTAPLRGAQ